MSNPMKEAAVREFFDAWSLYDQVLDQNYMFHEELYQDVQHLRVLLRKGT